MVAIAISISLIQNYIFFIFLLLSLSFSLAISESITIKSNNGSTSIDIHDILPTYNLPRGIMPDGVKSYSLSSKDGSFVVEMEHPCYVRFKFSHNDNDQVQLVYYEKVIKGKLSYGCVSHISGIQANKLFMWVSVTGLEVDSNSGMVEFHAGAITQKLPAQLFETMPPCSTSTNKPCSLRGLNLIPLDLALSS